MLGSAGVATPVPTENALRLSGCLRPAPDLNQLGGRRRDRHGALRGTPLHERALREGRILEAMPFAFYFIANLVMRLRKYDPLEYYDHLVNMHVAIASTLMTMRRLLADLLVPFRLLHALRTIGVTQDLRALRRIRHLLHTNPAFGAFHEGRSIGLLDYYRARIRRRLGSYADLL